MAGHWLEADERHRGAVREGVIDRWVALEMGKLREGLVLAPRPLSDLLLEEAPAATTRGGGTHAFDGDVLRRFADALSPLDRRRLRLPVTFYVDHELPDDAYVADETAARLLVGLGEVPAGVGVREGRLWLGHARARALAQRHPTGFQFVQH